ncbi:MAG: LON peptidase substrate-binding domain-containing protein [Arenicellales bacterium]
MRNSFTPAFNELPGELSVFPLTGAVILPNGQLPLNIFEERYLNMVFDALADSRLIGMAQPREDNNVILPELYSTGCAGRVVSFSETRDNRLLIVLAGVCRFDILEECDSVKGYRRFRVSWDRFADDLAKEDLEVDCAALLISARRFIEYRKLSVDWSALDTLALPELVDTLASSLPFSPEEKQGLVEQVVIKDRLELLTALCELGSVSLAEESSLAH